MDRYESLTGDRITKRLIEFHTAGFCGVNGFLMWPLAFDPAPEQDYISYMNYSVATTRWAIRAIADHMGIALTDPREPICAPLGFAAAGEELVRGIGALPAATPNDAYGRDAAAALARYIARWNLCGLDVQAENLADIAALIGEPMSDWEDAQARLDAFVEAGTDVDDERLVQHFHNWLMRQTFLVSGCGQASFLAKVDLQVIPER
jgi:hypothetical protein